MTSRLLRALGAHRGLLFAGAGLLLLVLLGARLVGTLETDGVATFEVRPGRFVREVEAVGSLKAVKATPVLAPPESGRAQKIAYLAKDGAILKQGDPVAEPGQKVRAVVRLEEAEGLIAIPRGAVFEKDGKRVVYRRADGRFSPVEITIGRQSISRVVLDSGLAAGDVIALRDPTEKRALGPAASGAGEAGK